MLGSYVNRFRVTWYSEMALIYQINMNTSKWKVFDEIKFYHLKTKGPS